MPTGKIKFYDRSVAFLTKQVRTQETLEFTFMDNEKIIGRLDGFDAYTIKVVTDANEKFLIHKHALKYIKKNDRLRRRVE